MRHLTPKIPTVMKVAIAVFLVAFAAHSQTTTCGGVQIDAPLTCTTDANGVQHIGIAPLTYTIKSSKSVRGEVPARSSNGVGWTLIHQPIAGVTCWRNGLYQYAGVGYALAKGAPYITAPSWVAGDVLACDYEW